MDTSKGCGFGGIIVIILLAIALFIFKDLWKVILIAIAAVAAIIIILVVVLSAKRRKEIASQAAEDGNASEKVAVYRKLLSNLMHYYYNIRDKDVKERLKRIEKAASKMIDIARNDARDLDKAGRFLRTSLDGATRMMESYRQLEKAPAGMESTEKAKADALGVLDKIITAFEAQTQRLYDNDVLNMDVETEVLNKTLDELWPQDDGQ